MSSIVRKLTENGALAALSCRFVVIRRSCRLLTSHPGNWPWPPADGGLTRAPTARCETSVHRRSTGDTARSIPPQTGVNFRHRPDCPEMRRPSTDSWTTSGDLSHGRVPTCLFSVGLKSRMDERRSRTAEDFEHGGN